MANVFDQFDAPAAKAEANPFDQFDAPATTAQKVIASAPMRAAKGGSDVAMGLAQFGPRIVSALAGMYGLDTVKQWAEGQAKDLDASINSAEKQYEEARKATGQDGFDAMRLAGNVATNLALPVKVGAAKTLTGAIGQGVKYGMISGALQPVLEGDDSFAEAKAKHVGVGAATGAIIPGTIALTKAAGSGVRSLVQPFTESGQDAIVGKVVKKFADGPVKLDARQIVQGSSPTLAEATGNPGIATLQRAVRDLRPQAFVEREAQNASARNALFDKIAGDPVAIEAAALERSRATNALLNQAFKDAAPANPQRAVELIDDILSGPAGKRDAVVSTLGNIRSKLMSADGGLEQSAANLYGVRKQIGDLLDKKAALSNPAAQQASRELIAVRNQLDKAIESAAPGFREYLTTYAEKSKPINAMEALQGLRLTDAHGNITLSKVQNAIAGLEREMKARGASNAKAVTADQLSALVAIRDDLLRQSSVAAGKSIGSNTFQNLATDNILSSMLPGAIGNFAGNKLGAALGQVGRLAYSGPNEAIRNKLVDVMLNPDLAAKVANGTGLLAQQPAQNALMQRLAPYLLQGGVAGVTAVAPQP